MPRPRKRSDGWAPPALPITGNEIGDIFEEHNAPRPDPESCAVLADVFTRRATPRVVDGREVAPACAQFTGLQYRAPARVRAREHFAAALAAIRAGDFPDLGRHSLEEMIEQMLMRADPRTPKAKKIATWAVDSAIIFPVVAGVLEEMGAPVGRHRGSVALRVSLGLLRRCGYSGMTGIALAVWLGKLRA
jgi:hypothetical protein